MVTALPIQPIIYRLLDNSAGHVNNYFEIQKTYPMKKLFLGITLVLSSVVAFSQGHLENVIVERITPSAAAVTADPALTGTTAYRVFVDLAAGWEMSGVYGETGNQLLIQTTTDFYNYAAGVYAGRSATSGQFGNAAGRLDSYITIGSFTGTRVGVQILEDPEADGDGYTTQSTNDNLAYSPGFDTQLETVFGADVTGTSSLSTFDGAWVDQTGYATTLFGNRILIGQFTTDGDFSFALNIQIRDLNGNIEKYTAGPATPTEINEYQYARLNYTSVVSAPVVTWISPAAANYNTGEILDLSVNATDAAPGTVSSVVFYRNSVIPANIIPGTVVNNSGVFTLAGWVAVEGTTALYAVATDNEGNATTSVPRSVVVTTPANAAPSVSVTAPVNGATLNLGTSFDLRATATDTDGTIASVVFFNGASQIMGTVTNAGNVYTLNWTPAATGNISITARATDNGGRSTTSAAVNAYVQDPNAGFGIIPVTANCSESDVFCMPIAVNGAITNAIGFDIPLTYDRTEVHPTGAVYVRQNLVTNYNYVSTYVNIDDAAGTMYISLAINGMAPAGTVFTGTGELVCVEFAKTIGFLPVDTATFSVAAPGIDISYANRVEKKLVTSGTYMTTRDDDFNGTLLFWSNNSPIGYNGSNLITNIYGSSSYTASAPLIKPAPPVTPDLAGKFAFRMGAYGADTARYIKVYRDIAAGSPVMSIVNGADAQLVARVVVNDRNYKPNIFQMFAMDVNRDGMVSAGDLTQIMQRTVGAYTEFKQTNNYNDAGERIAGSGSSKDWVFVPSDTLYAEQFRISTAWPQPEPAPGKGYSRYGLPIADTIQKVKIIGGDCPIVLPRTFQGIMLGDVNGSYATAPASATLKSTEKNAVVFDMANAKVSDGSIEVPVFFTSDEEVMSMDFALQFNEERLSLSAVAKNIADLEATDYFNSDERILRFTSYSMTKLQSGQSVAIVKFTTNGTNLTGSDLTPIAAFVNGNPAQAKVTDAKGMLNEVFVTVYPNPANDVLNIEVSADAKVVLMDMSGRSILMETEAVANQKQEMNVSGVADGMYMLKVYNNTFSEIKKVIIKK
jgi:hypothetical protein